MKPSVTMVFGYIPAFGNTQHMQLYYLGLIASSGKIILYMNIKLLKKIFESGTILIIIFIISTVFVTKFSIN